MTAPHPTPVPAAAHTADDAIALVRTWLERSRANPVRGSARLLAGLLAEQGGLPFLTEFVDGVVRPEDHRVAAATFRRLALKPHPYLPRYQRVLMKLGAVAAPFAPWMVVQVARRTVRAMVAHLVVDATPDKVGDALAKVRARGHRLNVNLLGEAVLGKAEAARRLERTRALIARDDVDYVSLKVSSAVAPHSAWAFDEAVTEIVDTLRPLFVEALERGGSFINLDMEEYRDLDLTIEVFTRLLGEERLRGLTAGIVLQAYLPDSAAALGRLETWAAERVARGGAPIKVRLVKGANLSMERVDAEMHGWPLATWGTKRDTDAHYKRLLDAALTPERTRHVRIGIAGHNLFDIAHAHLLASERGVSDAVDFEMLLGMGEHVALAVAEDVGPLRLYTPVVHPGEFDVALAYLVRRLEEVASNQNFMSSLYDLDTDPDAFERERSRFVEAWEAAMTPGVATHRAAAAALHEARPATAAADLFVNAADTDPAVASHRAWAREITSRAAQSTLGAAGLASARVSDAAHLSRVVGTARAGGEAWSLVPAPERAAVLRAVADGLERRRADLIEVMIADAGKTLEQADPEVSEAIDFARYYARRCLKLDAIPGARPVPRPLTLVTPPWNFPVAIPAGSTLAALAAGSGVILKPAEQAGRCGALLAEVMWEAGVPRDAVTLLDIDPEALGEALITDERIDQVILTGAYETAARFLEMRPGLRLFAETSGKNAIVVTPSADMDLAVRDVVSSAFGHAGQKCSAASLVILVGSVAESRRFLTQLEDAVRSLAVGPAHDPLSQVGPLIEAPSAKLERALTTLDAGETWLVEPTQWGTAATDWTPGVRAGVSAGSFFHLTECFGPVLGIMRAGSLEHAIELQNQVDYGLTAGLHSLDEHEIEAWLEGVEAGNLYVNRGITGAIVRRQPFGGWKRSVVGPTFKAGGPHYLQALTAWERDDAAGGGVDSAVDREEPSLRASKVLVDVSHAPDWVRVAAARDQAAWQGQFGTALDRTGLACEANVLRYRPSGADVRWDGDAPLEDVVRVFSAGLRAGGKAVVSVSGAFPADLARGVMSLGLDVRVESWEVCMERLAKRRGGGRVRVVGRVEGPAPASVAVYDGPVTTNPTLEMMPFLREQAISMTLHRFGTPFEPAMRVLERLKKPAE